jgi:hypothetical protein
MIILPLLVSMFRVAVPKTTLWYFSCFRNVVYFVLLLTIWCLQTMLNVGHQVLGLSSAGAVRVMLRTAPHPIFQRRNQLDLHTKLTITLREALLGFRKQIMHLSGKTVTVERLGVTPHGMLLFILSLGHS